jgi:hypothetical protein
MEYVLGSVTLFILPSVLVIRTSFRSRREKGTGQVAPQEIYRSKHLEQSPSSGKQQQEQVLVCRHMRLEPPQTA